jgi:hypothetical protein
VGNIDLKVIFASQNSNKFQKTRFWKEKSLEDQITFECLPFNSSRRNCDVPLVLLERFSQFKLNGIFVMIFGLRMWDDVDSLSSCYLVMGSHLQVYYSVQVNVFLSYLILKKWDISIPCKITLDVVSTLHYNDFILGPIPHATLVLICTNLRCMYFKVAYFLKKQKSTKIHFIMLIF